MNDLYKQLLDIIKDNNYTDEEIKLIEKAYKFACKNHEGMKRKNGEEYISHPLNVAIIVANLNTDATTVVSALIHETIKHGDATIEEITQEFGPEIADIIESLDKVNRLHLTENTEQNTKYMRKLLVALSGDVRVLILKLAGRVHNLETIDGLDNNLQKQKALETQNVLIPIVHRLGINSLKSKLEDLSFKILKPDLYNQIENDLPAPRAELNEILNQVLDELVDILNSNDITFEIKGRVKSVSSLSKKLEAGKTWKKIFDIIGCRIICETVPDCYLIIGLIHSKYKPIPGRFKDYIANPKGNSYQSLHTGIYGPDGYPIEVQVRTKEMNEIAEHGIASHWSYKEHGTKQIQSIMEQKLQMFRNIIDATSDELSDDQEFVSNVSIELLSKSIYVNTPAGDVVELPEGSSPIDFAYRIHSKVGDTCVGAIVNDEIVPLDYVLQDGDIIKIMTDANSKPKKDWLNIAKTTQAKSKIKSYFSKQDKEIYLERGKELLEKELRKQHIPISEAMSQEHQDKLINDLHVSTFDDIYLLIGSMRYTPIYIVDLIYEDKKNVEDTFLDKIKHQSFKKDNKYKNDILVSGNDDILVNLASCCKPVYGDDIIGYITKGDGITVHKKDCINVSGDKTRLIEVSWSDSRKYNDADKRYVAKLKIILNNTKKHDLLDIVAKATTRDIIITSINEIDKDTYSYYDALIKVKNKEDLDMFIDLLKTLTYIDDVRRI